MTRVQVKVVLRRDAYLRFLESPDYRTLCAALKSQGAIELKSISDAD